MSNQQPNFERRSLVATQWASLVMAISGVAAAWLSRSDALMLDGLFSGLAFLSAIIAIKVNESVERAPDRRRPFGYAANQPIFIAFRALVLLGIILFAGFAAIETILAYLNGAEIVALVLGPIFVYMVAMAIIAFGLGAYHKLNLNRDGTNSTLLRAEYVGAMMDGGISIAAGVALLGAPFLVDTFLESLVPVSDSIVVLALLAFFIPEPFRILRSAIGEVAGEAPPDEELVKLKQLVERTFAAFPVTVLEVTTQVLGRQTTVIAYIRPDEPITGETVDRLRDILTDACHKEVGPGFSEILIGARPAFEAEEK
jgi:predicted Co/Zn/Cd cation transporter (cation efflux family)